MTIRNRSLEARVERLEEIFARRTWRKCPAGALDALTTGKGTEADLELLYEDQKVSLREQLVALGVDRVLEPRVMGYVTWHWIAWILSYPLDAVVPDRYRRELADAAGKVNPYHRLLGKPSEYSPEQRAHDVYEWITEQLCVMTFERNDELEPRAEVAAQVPTDPAEIQEYLRAREEKFPVVDALGNT